jgi:hypothetical protein
MAKNPFKSLTKGLTKGLKTISKQSKQTIKKVTDTAKKSSAIINQLKNVFKQIKDIFKVFTCVGNIFKSIISHITCAVTLVANFPFCALYYCLDILYATLVGMPISFMTWILPPVKDVVAVVTDILEAVDKAVHTSTGLHIFHYSDSVKSRCYSCKITQMPNFSSLTKCSINNTKRAKRPIVYKKCDLN